MRGHTFDIHKAGVLSDCKPVVHAHNILLRVTSTSITAGLAFCTLVTMMVEQVQLRTRSQLGEYSPNQLPPSISMLSAV